MALIKCTDCKNEMSYESERCPKCGCPNKLLRADEFKGKLILFGGLAGIILLIVVVVNIKQYIENYVPDRPRQIRTQKWNTNPTLEISKGLREANAKGLAEYQWKDMGDYYEVRHRMYSTDSWSHTKVYK